ncbi:hypothetical protein AB4455_06225 [Vibrio sp. 10N.261.46.E12]|uniref:hypothetical protein n=1 Tax=unclassified Vibrio TaxID=2614977 RepID=UPI0018E44C0A|nr:MULTISPECIES: hypothetical protein [unclassified Vibrio]
MLANANVMQLQDNPTNMKLLALALVSVVALVLFVTGFDAIAATGTLESEFQDMWSEVKSLAAGAPGKILMMLMVLGVVFFSTVKPNLVGFAGCVVSVLVLANAGKIIDSSLTASILEAPSVVLPMIGL